MVFFFSVNCVEIESCETNLKLRRETHLVIARRQIHVLCLHLLQKQVQQIVTGFTSFRIAQSKKIRSLKVNVAGYLLKK